MQWLNRTILAGALAASWPGFVSANEADTKDAEAGNVVIQRDANPFVNPARPGARAGGEGIIVQLGGEGGGLKPGAPVGPWGVAISPREKGAYLGVSATPAPQVVRKQLDLPEGMGLVVDFVVPDGPATAAGLKQYDVLQKLDDQLLVNSDQFAVLVRSHKPGDEIKLTIIRQGKTMVITAKLVEHQLEVLGEGAWMQQELPEQMWRILPQPGVRTVAPAPGNGPTQFKMLMREPGSGAAASSTLIEGDHSYTISTDQAGHKTFIVKDKDGKSLFDGLIDTAEQRAKLPEDVKAKLDHMEQLTSKPGKNWGHESPKPDEKK